MDYGKAYDFNKSFSANFQTLLQEVPLPSLINLQANNAEYCNRSYANKNSYFLFMSDENQDCLYGSFLQTSQDCVDCSDVTTSNNCYECCRVKNGIGLFYAHHCDDCNLSSYLDYCK
jgi:hypothetical protein